MATTQTKLNESASSTGIAELLPDPMSLSADAPAVNADDLISSIADQQIDAMISEVRDDADPKPDPVDVADGAAELALQATQELAQMAEELNDQVSADLVADLTNAAIANASSTTNTSSAAIAASLKEEPAGVHEQKIVADQKAEPGLNAISGEPATPAPVELSALAGVEPVAGSTPIPNDAAAAVVAAERALTTAEAVPQSALAIGPLPALGPAGALESADTEINQEEIDALISNKPVVASDAVESHAEPIHADDVRRSLESSEHELARELAKEAASVAAHLPSFETPGRFSKLGDSASGALLTVLSWINLPVSRLPDSARELIGIAGIVTLVNAMALLLYLMIFG